jgi:histidinol-phosphate phosphatase family protein
MKNVKNKKIAFLDRDGTINRSPALHEYVTTVSDFIFNPGIFDVLHQLQNDGFELIVVTNQRGISRGIFTEEQLALIHNHMKNRLQEHGIGLLDVFYCPHANDSCECRKPSDGMLKAAAKKYPIIISDSIIIGDSQSDMIAGEKFGLSKCYLVSTDMPEEYLNFM